MVSYMTSFAWIRDCILRPPSLAGGWTRVINVLRSTKQNEYAITGALNAGKYDSGTAYKLSDKHINEIAADAGTKDFLLICSDEVEFGV